MNVGFTGTQVGMTLEQAAQIAARIEAAVEVGYTSFHHGDCIGADAQAHAIAIRFKLPVHIHPPEDGRKRAFCKGAAVEHAPRPYLQRNHDIVDSVDILLATPRDSKEVLRSGTWATIRYARKRGIIVVVVFPNGSVCVTR